MRPLPDRLLVVTDRHQARRPLPDVIEAVLDAGARWVWFRDRDLPPDERRVLAAEILDRVRRAGGILVIGGDIALASALAADGVHLSDPNALAAARAALGPAALIGLSAHSVEDCRRAARDGADYACLSPIFETPSKPGYGPPLGLAALTIAGAHVPVVALGGILPARAPECFQAGASAIAVMGGIMRADDAGAATRDYTECRRKS